MTRIADPPPPGGWRLVPEGDPASATAPGDRALARAQVEGAALPPDLDEVRTRVLALCDAGPDPLDRASLPDHLTASAVVVDPERGALLLHHAKLRRWFQPGGHVDGDGNLLSAAWREATEESGIDGLVGVLPAVDLDVHDVPYPDGSFHVHHDLRFLFLAPAGSEASINHESTGVRWVRTEADLDAVDADESTRRLVRRGLAVVTAVDR